jgi:phage/plasmid primase-like uncharacterized protein
MLEREWVDPQHRWQNILSALGLPAKFLDKKHGPCPICGGEDRYRWINTNGNGTWVCTHCVGGDGWDMVQEYFSRLILWARSIWCGQWLEVRL